MEGQDKTWPFAPCEWFWDHPKPSATIPPPLAIPKSGGGRGGTTEKCGNFEEFGNFGGGGPPRDLPIRPGAKPPGNGSGGPEPRRKRARGKIGLAGRGGEG